MANKRRTNKQEKNDSASGFKTFLYVICFFAPPLIYAILVEGVFPPANSGYGIYGIFGAICIGFAFMIFLGALERFRKIYLLALGFMIFGLLLVVPSLVIMYVPAVYAFVDQYFTGQYFIMPLFLIALAINYPAARSGIAQALRNQNLSKTRIKDLMKGRKNFWWYEEVHKQFSLGFIYWTNKVFTIGFAVTVPVHLLFGWLQPVRFAVAVNTAMLHFLSSIMLFYSAKEHGKDKKVDRYMFIYGGWAFAYIVFGVAILIYFL